MPEMADREHHESPPEPPPFLSQDQLLHLLTQGWLMLPDLEQLTRNTSALFQHLPILFDKPTSVKKQLYPSKGAGTEFGYYHVENEKEYLTVRSRDQVSTQPLDPDLESEVLSIWKPSAALLHRILCDISRTSDLSHTIWDNLLDDGALTLSSKEQDMSTTLLRLFQYFPGQTGVAMQHTDMGLLTLCIGEGQGLQVLQSPSAQDPGSEPTWIDATGPVILTGEYLRKLSNGLIRAGVHRVVGNPAGRKSIVFALRPSLKHEIDLSDFGCGEGGKVHARQLWKDIQERKFNINATHGVRDEQRERQRLQAVKEQEKLEREGKPAM